MRRTGIGSRCRVQHAQTTATVKCSMVDVEHDQVPSGMASQTYPQRRGLGQGNTQAVQLGPGPGQGVIIRALKDPKRVQVGFGPDLPAVLPSPPAGR